ncbi:DNA-directed RNA polymerase III subunit RPC10-like [Paramacrobiotus metropolitanus]|uniref:DNA-directed RNA polymerase III subunit RPC10-like n=1 Tax=Paramacrobiotus metropolitanus TaxID=2943436 RepID=UPI00244601D0|nr:DNA-directed RNA polymerase III subunit RPC10-like [Paramacrobiotus metropolitanus]
MIIICEQCKGFMQVSKSESHSSKGYHVACRVCKSDIPVADLPGGVLVCSFYPKLKEFSEVLSGDDNAGRNETESTCPKCNHKRAYYHQMQTRSADEPMTIFYKCVSCGNQWREN